jgi:hypothetical protein
MWSQGLSSDPRLNDCRALYRLSLLMKGRNVVPPGIFRGILDAPLVSISFGFPVYPYLFGVPSNVPDNNGSAMTK